MARLTEKQKRFVAEYLVDLNATQAAARAGYKDPNIGRQLITKNNVSQAIQDAMGKRAERTEITQDMVVRELAAIGFAKVTDHVQVLQGGCVEFTPTKDLTDTQKSALAWVKNGKFGVDMGFHDKVKALELLGKHLGMFDARTAQQQEQENNLVERLLGGTEEDIDTDDLPEIE